MLMRIELIEGSISTCSFSVRAMCIGFNTISDDVLNISKKRRAVWGGGHCFYFRDVVAFYDLGGEILEAEGGGEARADTVQVGP